MKERYKMSKLGEIPLDWEIVKIEEIAEVKGGKRLPKGESLVEQKNSHPYIRVADMNMGWVDTNNLLYVPDEVFPKISRYTINHTDLYISVAGTLGVVGKIPKSLDGANLTENANKLTNIQISQSFLLQLLISPIIQDSIEKEKTNNAQPKLALTRIRNFLIPKPPIKEQQKIAKILSTVDEKIAVIDEQLQATKALKKGLMQRLLTKGIGHTVFKDSVLGEIPMKWEVLKFGKLISKHGYGPRFSSKDYDKNGNVKTIRGTDINLNGEILFNQVPTAKLLEEVISNHKLKNLDLVMITTADCGLTGVYEEQAIPFIPSAYAVKISLNEHADAYFFKYLLQTDFTKNQVEKFIRKGTVGNLPGSDILKFKFRVPPIEEQQEIAKILSIVDEKLQVLKDKKAQYQTLKKGLMQNLLTGKIRVKLNDA